MANKRSRARRNKKSNNWKLISQIKLVLHLPLYKLNANCVFYIRQKSKKRDTCRSTSKSKLYASKGRRWIFFFFWDWNWNEWLLECGKSFVAIRNSWSRCRDEWPLRKRAQFCVWNGRWQGDKSAPRFILHSNSVIAILFICLSKLGMRIDELRCVRWTGWTWSAFVR